ncbi:MAG: High-affinity zinc uptake system protein ZnuA precursor [candidate division WS6 bacterium OLB20]|uniref:High-affinity zinc uptake system protein ZnuA n=1 Tax=candidate division WS6 bacterium OLB20 TaxID=1617426 RepID=A0A136LWG5_9BACT|nr:MAG: High-affinity zinc uptake system protein ZnuA precursor [candidate division WS6 bacterium OLB20]
MKKLFPVVVAFILIAAGVAVLLTGSPVHVSKETVAASIPPVASLTRQIAGDHIEVVQILPAGASPHTYSLKVSDRENLEQSALVFVIGHGIDDWVSGEFVEQERIVTLDRTIELLDYDDEHGHEGEEHEEEASHTEGEEHEEETGEEHEEHTGTDPHYWMSAGNAVLMAETITEELKKLAPEHSEVFDANLDRLRTELLALRDDAATRFSQVSDPEIITFHDAFSYFADETGIEIVASIEEFPGREPSAAYLQSVGEQITENNVTVLFKEPQLSDAVIQPLADDYGASVYTLDPLGGTSERMAYQDMYRYNVETLLQAFAGR